MIAQRHRLVQKASTSRWRSLAATNLAGAGKCANSGAARGVACALPPARRASRHARQTGHDARDPRCVRATRRTWARGGSGSRRSRRRAPPPTGCSGARQVPRSPSRWRTQADMRPSRAHGLRVRRRGSRRRLDGWRHRAVSIPVATASMSEANWVWPKFEPLVSQSRCLCSGATVLGSRSSR